MLWCGAMYAKCEQKAVEDELEEIERLLEIFICIKNEIEEFDAPLHDILKRKGVENGIEGLISKISSATLRNDLAEAKKLGRNYKKEELRTCGKVILSLGERKKLLEVKVKEKIVMSRVKGIGGAVAVIILLL